MNYEEPMPVSTESLLVVHYKEQLANQQAYFEQKLEALKSFFEQRKPEVDYSHIYKDQLEENQSLRKQNQDIEDAFKAEIVNLRNEINYLEDKLQSQRENLEHSRQQSLLAKKKYDKGNYKYIDIKSRFGAVQDRIKELKDRKNVNNDFDIRDYNRIVNENAMLRDENDRMIRELAMKDAEESINKKKKPKYAETQRVAYSPEILEHIEDRLLRKQIEYKRLLEEFQKIPEHPKRRADIDKRNRMERELEFLENEINSLKVKLRG